MIEEISVEDYKSRFSDGGEDHLLLDVRTVEEFEEVRIPGSVNVPLDELFLRVEEIRAAAGDAPVVLVCRSGARSMMGAQMLRQAGFNSAALYNLDMGLIGWARQRWPLEQG